MVRDFGSVFLRLAGGAPSGLTQISASTASEYGFMGDALPEGTVEGGDRGRTFWYSRDVRGEIVGEEVSTESGEDGGSEEEDGGSDRSEEESITNEWTKVRQLRRKV